MRTADLLHLALANLRRNRTRSILTLVGVMIGVAALVALVSYGSGLQKNARSEFDSLELYNTLRVTSEPTPFGNLGEVARLQRDLTNKASEAGQPLTDALIDSLNQIPGVFAAFPEVVFPALIVKDSIELAVSAEAIPQSFASLPAYTPTDGDFFPSAADTSLLIAPSIARRLGYDPAKSIVGDTLLLQTAQLNVQAMRSLTNAISLGMTTLPIQQADHPMRVAGLLPDQGQVVSGFLRVIVPLETAKSMQKISFFSTVDLLMRRAVTQGYQAARVQIIDRDDLNTVRDSIEAKNVFAASFRDQFQQLERLFIIMDLALGIIGFIALLVATIGIANTMMMNVMERYQEIGVMKAVGGDESDVQKLFIVESGTLGLVGGVFGLILGWLLTRLINALVGVYLTDFGISGVDVFHTSAWLVVGVLIIALLVSLLAGVAPARRAARIDPLEALRSV